MIDAEYVWSQLIGRDPKQAAAQFFEAHPLPRDSMFVRFTPTGRVETSRTQAADQLVPHALRFYHKERFALYVHVSHLRALISDRDGFLPCVLPMPLSVLESVYQVAATTCIH